MIRLAHRKGSVSAIVGGALFFLGAPAGAQSLPYTPTTTLTPLQIGTTTFPITQINDGVDGAMAINGFGSNAASGDIAFTFATPMDLTNVSVWNNIVVDATGGAKDFTLEFFDDSLNTLGVSSYTAPNNAGPFQANFSYSGVSRVVMHIINAYTRIEIREVRFGGRPASYTLGCAEIRRMGFPLTTQTIQRSSNAVDRHAITIPYSYSVSPLRAYGDTQANRMFIDSFPLNPNRDRHVCEADVTVTGSSGNVQNNDGANVFIPDSPGEIWEDHHGWHHGSLLHPNKLLTDGMGPWTYQLSLSGTNASMTQALAHGLHSTIPGGPYIDIWVHDDSVVNSVSIAYILY